MSIRNPVVSEKFSPNFSLAFDANISTSGVSRSRAFLPLIDFTLSRCHSFLPRSDVFIRSGRGSSKLRDV
jgi:hypothetical protein